MNTLTLKARLADRDRRRFFVTFLGGKLLGLGVALYAIFSLGPWIVGTVAHAASVPRADDIQTQVTGAVNGSTRRGCWWRPSWSSSCRPGS